MNDIERNIERINKNLKTLGTKKRMYLEIEDKKYYTIGLVGLKSGEFDLLIANATMREVFNHTELMERLFAKITGGL